MSITGAQVIDKLLLLSGQKREDAMLSLASDPTNLPPWMLSFVPIEWTVDIGGKPRSIQVRVTPDFFSFGGATDFLRVPMWPTTVQSICDQLGLVMISKFLSNKIVEKAFLHAPFQVVPAALPKPSPRMETTEAWVQDQRMCQDALGSYNPGALVAGFKKDVVTGPHLDGAKVAIYGAMWPNGTKVQPYSTIHPYNYSDYSHGVRLVSRQCVVDGQSADLYTIFQDPVLCALVSDQGPFLPRFPSSGAGAVASAPSVATAGLLDLLPEKREALRLRDVIVRHLMSQGILVHSADLLDDPDHGTFIAIKVDADRGHHVCGLHRVEGILVHVHGEHILPPRPRDEEVIATPRVDSGEVAVGWRYGGLEIAFQGDPPPVDPQIAECQKIAALIDGQLKDKSWYHGTTIDVPPAVPRPVVRVAISPMMASMARSYAESNYPTAPVVIESSSSPPVPSAAPPSVGAMAPVMLAEARVVKDMLKDEWNPNTNPWVRGFDVTALANGDCAAVIKVQSPADVKRFPSPYFVGRVRVLVDVVGDAVAYQPYTGPGSP